MTRYNILTKKSTKTERIFYEILKELKLPFRHRWLIDNMEIDFLIGNIAIEIDGHRQDVKKNSRLVELGYVPIHLENREVLKDKNKIKKEIKNLCQTQHLEMD